MSKRQGHEGLYCLSGLVGNCCYDVSDVLSINHGIDYYIVLQVFTLKNGPQYIIYPWNL